MIWKYKIELKDVNVFTEYEKKYNILIPEALIELIKKANGATPEKDCIIIGKMECEVGAILSFNKDEQGVDSFETAMSLELDNSIIPFAISPGGDYFCVNSKNNCVCYWQHEEQELCETDIIINNFEDKLYK